MRHTNMPYMEHSSLLKCDTMWSSTHVPMIHRFLCNTGTLQTCINLYSNQREHNKSQCAVRSVLHTFILFAAKLYCHVTTDNKYQQHPDMKVPINWDQLFISGQKGESKIILKNMGKRVKNLHIRNNKPLQFVRPWYRMAFKIPLVSSILHVGQPEPSPFKCLVLSTMGHLGKCHSFSAPQ